MERIEAYCPPPLVSDMDDFAEEQGYENRSQVIRALIRTGLTYHNTVSPGISAPVEMEEETELDLEPELERDPE